MSAAVVFCSSCHAKVHCAAGLGSHRKSGVVKLRVPALPSTAEEPGKSVDIGSVQKVSDGAVADSVYVAGQAVIATPDAVAVALREIVRVPEPTAVIVAPA